MIAPKFYRLFAVGKFYHPSSSENLYRPINPPASIIGNKATRRHLPWAGGPAGFRGAGKDSEKKLCYSYASLQRL